MEPIEKLINAQSIHSLRLPIAASSGILGAYEFISHVDNLGIRVSDAIIAVVFAAVAYRSIFNKHKEISSIGDVKWNENHRAEYTQTPLIEYKGTDEKIAKLGKTFTCLSLIDSSLKGRVELTDYGAQTIARLNFLELQWYVSETKERSLETGTAVADYIVLYYPTKEVLPKVQQNIKLLSHYFEKIRTNKLFKGYQAPIRTSPKFCLAIRTEDVPLIYNDQPESPVLSLKVKDKYPQIYEAYLAIVDSIRDDPMQFERFERLVLTTLSSNQKLKVQVDSTISIRRSDHKGRVKIPMVQTNITQRNLRNRSGNDTQYMLKAFYSNSDTRDKDLDEIFKDPQLAAEKELIDYLMHIRQYSPKELTPIQYEDAFWRLRDTLYQTIHFDHPIPDYGPINIEKSRKSNFLKQYLAVVVITMFLQHNLGLIVSNVSKNIDISPFKGLGTTDHQQITPLNVKIPETETSSNNASSMEALLTSVGGQITEPGSKSKQSSEKVWDIIGTTDNRGYYVTGISHDYNEADKIWELDKSTGESYSMKSEIPHPSELKPHEVILTSNTTTSSVTIPTWHYQGKYIGVKDEGGQFSWNHSIASAVKITDPKGQRIPYFSTIHQGIVSIAFNNPDHEKVNIQAYLQPNYAYGLNMDTKVQTTSPDSTSHPLMIDRTKLSPEALTLLDNMLEVSKHENLYKVVALITENYLYTLDPSNLDERVKSHKLEDTINAIAATKECDCASCNTLMISFINSLQNTKKISSINMYFAVGFLYGVDGYKPNGSLNTNMAHGFGIIPNTQIYDGTPINLKGDEFTLKTLDSKPSEPLNSKDLDIDLMNKLLIVGLVVLAGGVVCLNYIKLQQHAKKTWKLFNSYIKRLPEERKKNFERMIQKISIEESRILDGADKATKLKPLQLNSLVNSISWGDPQNISRVALNKLYKQEDKIPDFNRRKLIEFLSGPSNSEVAKSLTNEELIQFKIYVTTLLSGN